MKMNMDPRVAAAIAHAVNAAIATVGLKGLRETSMFPSSAKLQVEYKLAA